MAPRHVRRALVLILTLHAVAHVPCLTRALEAPVRVAARSLAMACCGALRTLVHVLTRRHAVAREASSARASVAPLAVAARCSRVACSDGAFVDVHALAGILRKPFWASASEGTCCVVALHALIAIVCVGRAFVHVQTRVHSIAREPCLASAHETARCIGADRVILAIVNSCRTLILVRAAALIFCISLLAVACEGADGVDTVCVDITTVGICGALVYIDATVDSIPRVPAVARTTESIRPVLTRRQAVTVVGSLNAFVDHFRLWVRNVRWRASTALLESPSVLRANKCFRSY
mmetsp:Transcript_39104/g.80066  ORF Transcript_39104/g.80066 Transcript_39104/m.80066 type:complete len:293 (-) Transcript_39104:246-1124(-)